MSTDQLVLGPKGVCPFCLTPMYSYHPSTAPKAAPEDGGLAIGSSTDFTFWKCDACTAIFNEVHDGTVGGKELPEDPQIVYQVLRGQWDKTEGEVVVDESAPRPSGSGLRLALIQGQELHVLQETKPARTSNDILGGLWAGPSDADSALYEMLVDKRRTMARMTVVQGVADDDGNITYTAVKDQPLLQPLGAQAIKELSKELRTGEAPVVETPATEEQVQEERVWVGGLSQTQWYVTYTLDGQEMREGPYSLDNVRAHYSTLRGRPGVSGARIVPETAPSL